MDELRPFAPAAGAGHTGLRETIRRASGVIAHYWPMRTFVHHNPLHGLEDRHFEEAVRQGQTFLGARGYLTNDQYRAYVRSGRIRPQHLDAALRPLAQETVVELGAALVTHRDVLRAHLLAGATAPARETVEALVRRSPDRETIAALSARLAPASPGQPDAATALGHGETLAAWCDRVWHTGLTALIDREVIKWCKAFLDEGYSTWTMPGREQGFYQAWKTLAGREWSPCGISRSRAKIAALPAAPEDALLEHLAALGIPDDARQDYLAQHLTALCGWASFINWRAGQTDYDWQQAYPVSLEAYLAVRVWYERELVRQTCRERLGGTGTLAELAAYQDSLGTPVSDPQGPQLARLAAAWQLVTLAPGLQLAPADLLQSSPADLQLVLDWVAAFPEAAHGPVWLKAFEAGFQDELLHKIRTSLANSKTTQSDARPLAQLMFCIDVRSEPFRRHLEAVNHYETIGVAGFFGMPITHRALDADHGTAQVPAIASPKYTVQEVATSKQSGRLARHTAGVAFLETIAAVMQDLKSHVLTPYIAVEAIGWLYSLPMVGKTLVPALYRRVSRRVTSWLAPPVATTLTVDRTPNGLGLTLDEQTGALETALRTMGLTANFGRLVVVCGHGSTTANNPFEAALDCGACGGNPGKANARVFAMIANKPEVRTRLARNGIVIPADTVVIAAQHDTTTDGIALYDLDAVPATHAADLARLQEDLRLATFRTNRERYARLPRVKARPTAKDVSREISRRSADWSQVQPEWGLAGNAAYVIGRRDLTRWVDLGGRVFLNSYDYRADATGALLEAIMTGPQVVGQWINTEHYFSTTDPEVFGAGSKVYHNVVGKFGVMSGPQGDLRTGLASQTIALGPDPYHEPLRLLAVIEAPRRRISEIMARHRHVQQLYDNQWVHLVAVDPDDEAFYRYEPHRGWVVLPDATTGHRQGAAGAARDQG